MDLGLAGKRDLVTGGIESIGRAIVAAGVVGCAMAAQVQH